MLRIDVALPHGPATLEIHASRPFHREEARAIAGAIVRACATVDLAALEPADALAMLTAAACQMPRVTRALAKLADNRHAHP